MRSEIAVRKRKPSGRLSSGPWTADQIVTALKSDGWVCESEMEHHHYVHPDRGGRKVQVDPKWTGVKKGSVVYNGVHQQAGYSSRELQELLNRR